MNNVFVLYDRMTDTVWYPLTDKAFDAVAGSKKGTKLEFVSKPEPELLGDWARKHPETKVMLPPKQDRRGKPAPHGGGANDG